MKNDVILSQVYRGGLVESVHRGAAVAVRGGQTILHLGDPGSPSFYRSSSKPLQALAVFDLGVGERFNLSDEHLVIVAASHSGEDQHVRVVKEMLKRAGLTEAHLACAGGIPLAPQVRDRLLKAGKKITPARHNCSGKHAGMLLACVARGWPVEGYNDPAHPVQVHTTKVMARLCGLAPEEIGLGVDGCSVPNFYMPLFNMALGISRLADPAGLPRRWQRVIARLNRGIAANPVLFAGKGRICTALPERSGGRILGKGGAEGLYCIWVPEAKVGLAVKVSDGNSRGYPPVLMAMLKKLGLLTPADAERFADYIRPPIKDVRGVVVGEIRYAGRLRRG